jgi:ligand-binding sensor domain-containing protein/signal transduction histidine kinase
LLVRTAVGALVALCLASCASASDPDRLLSQYVQTSWGPEKGFPGGSISSIAQTPDGYLWIATDRTLIRFDGFSFRKFEQASPDTFPIGPVKTLVVDGQGNLWVLLQNTKLLRYHEGSFELSRGEAENGITAICRSTNGGVLVSSLARGILAYDGKQFEAVSGGPVFEDPVARANGVRPDQRNTRLSWSTGVTSHLLMAPTSAVISMASASDGKIWLGTQDKGLFLLTGKGATAASYGLPGEKIFSLLPLSHSELWIGTSKGLVRWTGTEFTRVDLPAPLQRESVLSLTQDSDSNIWVGTAHGLLRFNASGASFLSKKRLGTDSSVNAVFVDREHNLWVGSGSVLERLRNSSFMTYSVADGLPSDRNGPVYVDAEGRTWFAPLEGGLYWKKGNQQRAVTAAGLPVDVVYSISGRENEVMVGRQRGGLTVLRMSGHAITAKTYTQRDGLAENSVYAVHAGRDGSVWAGTLGSGVSVLRNGRFSTYATADGLSSNMITSITESLDGTIWVATSNGLNALSNGRWRVFTIKDGLPSMDLVCVFADSSGVLWIGSTAGIAYLSSDHVQVPVKAPEAVRDPVFGIAEDRRGWLWLATSHHLLRVQRSGLLGTGVTGTDMREYGEVDGVVGLEGVKRHRSVVADSAGRIWFSTNRGLSVVDPARAAASSPPALVHIEGIAGDGTALDLGNPIHFPAGTRRATFRYVGLSLSNSERVRYRYRLDGVDRGWSEGGADREATYNNLAAGTYRFRVMASNSDGMWNNTDASIVFSVLPEFYQTYWFRISCAAVFFAFLWAIYQLRVQQLQHQFNVALDARVNERTRIARELHDTLLQTLHGLMFRCQAARNMFANRPDEALAALDGAIRRTEEAIVESRDAIKDLRIEFAASTDLGELLTGSGQELETSAQETADRPTFRLIVAGERQELNPGVQDEVYRIGRELMRNAFQHAHAHHIEAEIRYDDHALTLLVRDDGRGIDPTVVKEGGRAGHWGLPGIRERAKQINGHLDFWTENGAGTEVQLKVPGAVAYKAPEQVRFKLFGREKVS